MKCNDIIKKLKNNNLMQNLRHGFKTILFFRELIHFPDIFSTFAANDNPMLQMIGFVIPRTATFGFLVILTSLVSTGQVNHNCPSSALHELFVESLVDYGLTQMVDKPTRLSNTLDLFIT